MKPAQVCIALDYTFTPLFAFLWYLLFIYSFCGIYYLLFMSLIHTLDEHPCNKNVQDSIFILVIVC